MSWLYKSLVAQIAFAVQVLQLNNDIDIAYFAIGNYYQLPMILAKLLRKKIICASTGIDSSNAEVNYGGLLAKITSGLSRFNFSLADVIVVESLRLGVEKDLRPFQSKIRYGALYLEDPAAFNIHTPINLRRKIVGFVGRLTREKGILEFIHSFPSIFSGQKDIEIVIIGTGRLDEEVNKLLKICPRADQVTWEKWVDHKMMPDYLNRMKLIVVPSYSEGLPNIILEAMGCGTLVLASRVGGIPDLICEHETGFLFDSLGPESIANHVIQAINFPGQIEVSRAARDTIEKNYLINSAVERYKEILNVLDRMSGSG